MKYNYLKLAEMLKEKREDMGISTRKLAEKIDISHTEISRIENGMRPNFSFLILAKLCKELKIDMMNLLDDAGVWQVDYDQLFYVMVKQEEEKIFKIHARSEFEAARIVCDLVYENQLMDFSKSEKDILIGAVKNPKDFDKEIIKNYEETGNLLDKNKETDDEEMEEDSEENMEIDGVICPEDCIYYCPNCGNCTIRE